MHTVYLSHVTTNTNSYYTPQWIHYNIKVCNVFDVINFTRSVIVVTVYP